ncbi:response regulator [Sinimarinibacterium sp. CAU 1509]|uniref:response regulator n=1 Tax=Sinimarinibacterium sp. CAU 1509 TaxID=2562283 RepID=UPI0010AD7C30|nr:response regulator [Sinimarinibacterium sp. CAU 1509]TJY64947.1 response regulator [Sinimarinibacterium sp. CAU 1509]
MRILIVEDDALLGDGLQAGLRQRGFDADWVRDGSAALLAVRSESYAATVLDLGLPGIDGMEVLSQLRAQRSAVPVLILTARDAIDDRIRGLDGGADDYVLKPVDIDELAARLRALVRRAHGEAQPELRNGELVLNPATHTVHFRGQPVELGAREFALLHELLLGAGRVLTREQLESRLYGWGDEVESNAIEVHIHHLRRKLEPEVIRTVRGVGYLMPRAD